MQAESRIALVYTQPATDRLSWPLVCEPAASLCPHSCDFADRAVDVQIALHSSSVKGGTHAKFHGKIHIAASKE